MKKQDVKQEAAPSPRRGDRTRQQIKKAIAKLANNKDLSQITLAEICETAQLTTGALYFHFAGREEAIEEMVIDQVASLYGAQLREPSDSFRTFVAKIVDANTEFCIRNKQMPRVIATSIFTRPKVYAAWLEARDPVVHALRALIAEERASHSLSMEEAPYLALFILNSIEDLAIDVFQWGNPALAPFAEQPELWRDRQTELWAWTILTPFADRSVR